MKLVPAMIFLYALLLSTILFNGINQDTNSYNLINESSVQNNTSIFNSSTNYYFWYLFINPTRLSTSAIWGVIVLSLLGVGLGVTISLVSKSDLGVLLGVFVILFGSGVVALIPIYQVVYSQITELAVAADTEGCSISAVAPATCMPSIIFAGLVVGSFALYWFFVCLEWWTARTTS